MTKPSITAIKRAVRLAEINSKTGGTGQTILKFQAKPIARLVDAGAIGRDELQAADDISLAFNSMAGALMVRAQTWERVDRGYGSTDSAKVIDAQRRYRGFADHWSMRRNGWGDRTLEILISAIIDEAPFYLIDQRASLRHGRARKATIRGLRDYAVRAGWVRGVLGARWKAEASLTFPQMFPRMAMASA